MQEWQSLKSSTKHVDGSHSQCPITIDKSEADAVIEAAMKQEEADSQLEILRNIIGIGVDGWVTHEGYDDAVARAAEMKEQAVAFAENETERDLTIRDGHNQIFDLIASASFEDLISLSIKPLKI
jgi:hypothetical protein